MELKFIRDLNYVTYQLIFWYGKLVYKMFKIGIVFTNANETCFSIKILNFDK